MSLFSVRAVAGRQVRDPQTRQPIPEVGADAEDHLVELDAYWRRRVADQDIEAVEAATDETPSPARTTKPKAAPRGTQED